MPSDNSEIDEYLETIPSTCGNEASGQNNDAQSGGGAGDAPVSPATVERLETLGSDGEAAAAARGTALPSLAERIGQVLRAARADRRCPPRPVVTKVVALRSPESGVRSAGTARAASEYCCR